jgi:hypothetical protein
MATGLAQLDRATGWVDQLVTYTVDESSNLLSRSNSFYMIVSILGKVVDVDKIVSISKIIYGYPHSAKYYNDREEDPDATRFFEVKLINDSFKVTQEHVDPSTEDNLTEIRNKLIVAWLGEDYLTVIK